MHDTDEHYSDERQSHDTDEHYFDVRQAQEDGIYTKKDSVSYSQALCVK